MGGMAIFGSYIVVRITRHGRVAAGHFLDTFVAVLAGTSSSSAGLHHTRSMAGPSLLFDTMAGVFGNMAGGRWWGALFFLFGGVCGAVHRAGRLREYPAMVRELTGWSRPKGCVVCGVGIFAGADDGAGLQRAALPAVCAGQRVAGFWGLHHRQQQCAAAGDRWCWRCSAATALAGADNFVAEVEHRQGPEGPPLMKPI